MGIISHAHVCIYWWIIHRASLQNASNKPMKSHDDNQNNMQYVRIDFNVSLQSCAYGIIAWLAWFVINFNIFLCLFSTSFTMPNSWPTGACTSSHPTILPSWKEKSSANWTETIWSSSLRTGGHRYRILKRWKSTRSCLGRKMMSAVKWCNVGMVMVMIHRWCDRCLSTTSKARDWYRYGWMNLCTVWLTIGPVHVMWRKF